MNVIMFIVASCVFLVDALKTCTSQIAGRIVLSISAKLSGTPATVFKLLVDVHDPVDGKLTNRVHAGIALEGRHINTR